MAKKPAPPPEKPKFKRGDAVHLDGTKARYCITWISEDGLQADIGMESANLEWFKISVDRLTPADV